MSSALLQLIPVSLVLFLLQGLAAIPWVIVLTKYSFRQEMSFFLKKVVGGTVAAGLVFVFILQSNSDPGIVGGVRREVGRGQPSDESGGTVEDDVVCALGCHAGHRSRLDQPVAEGAALPAFAHRRPLLGSLHQRHTESLRVDRALQAASALGPRSWSSSARRAWDGATQ